ncbi:4,5-DOPA dioxygenase extradiol [Thermomonas sp.]|uniref:4,5-DOPA-extradiol-dioxygenase n=1 Tax=Thermomonas sp. TaxID=1971895 RepID=UPI002489870E|nr:4,5-DOPA dioxygenase extradiol [Thermomonas sp.]MDI1252598.1 4,5-DOPA dioxygenase extradiol [Thermomonas sp.]
MSTTLMPAAFLGHGSPMNALEHNRYTEAWRTFGVSVPRPRAILALSAHWHINALAVTAMPQPRTIHDFYGFPQALFDVQYPAPGLPELAEEVADLVKPDHVGFDIDGWGLDHGTWSVLVHAFPDADTPVVQLSLDARQPFEWHLAMGTKLAALRERGVLIVGSGNVVHNLRAIDRQQPDGAFDWAERFNTDARVLMTERPHDVPSLASHRDYRLAVPTDEHFLPLLYLAGLASAAGKPAQVLVDGYAYGSLSMASYTLDAHRPRENGDIDGDGAAPLDTTLPPEDANI